MQRIEVEGDHVARAAAEVHDGSATHKIILTPCLAADHEGLSFAVTPLEHDAAGIDRSVKTGGAIRHAQPAARQRVEREVLSEHPGTRRISIGYRMLRSRERHPHVCARRLRRCALRGGRGGFTTARGAWHTARLAAHAAHQPALEGQHGAVAERDEQSAGSHKLLQLGKSGVADAPGDVVGRGRSAQTRRGSGLLEGHRRPGLVEALDLLGEFKIHVSVQHDVVLVLQPAGTNVLIAHVDVRNVTLIERVARPTNGVGVRPRHPQTQPRHRRLVLRHPRHRVGADKIEAEFSATARTPAASPACGARIQDPAG